MIDYKYGKIDIDGTPEDEPCFVLRAQDCFAVGILKMYLLFAGHMPGIHGSIIKHNIELFENWKHKKLPDTFNEK